MEVDDLIQCLPIHAAIGLHWRHERNKAASNHYSSPSYKYLGKGISIPVFSGIYQSITRGFNIKYKFQAVQIRIAFAIV